MALTLTGLVERPFDIPPDALASQRIERIEDFVCLEGWTKPDQAWSGYRMDDLVRLAGPTKEARYVEVASGDFVAVLPLSALPQALLADTQNGHSLGEGSWRLVISGGPCYNSVKGVDRITVVNDDRGETARTISLTRIGKAEDI